MVKSIYLQDGEEVFVDDEDYERVNQYTWWKTFHKNTRCIISKNDRNEFIYLIQLIQNDSYQLVKNNYFTKDNLTNKGNAQRWRKANNNNNSSKYKGVNWDKALRKWRVKIKVGSKSMHIGYYYEEDAAATAYNQAVLDHWEGNGYLNVIGKDNRTTERSYKTKKNQNIVRKGNSGFRGVNIRKNNKRISSQIQFKQKKYHLGDFKTIKSAALAYNKCAIYLHGNEVILNDVPITDELKEFIDNWEIPEKVKALKEGATSE